MIISFCSPTCWTKRKRPTCTTGSVGRNLLELLEFVTLRYHKMEKIAPSHQTDVGVTRLNQKHVHPSLCSLLPCTQGNILLVYCLLYWILNVTCQNVEVTTILYAVQSRDWEAAVWRSECEGQKQCSDQIKQSTQTLHTSTHNSYINTWGENTLHNSLCARARVYVLNFNRLASSNHNMEIQYLHIRMQ